MRLTFKQRGTVLSNKIEAFTDDFIDIKQTQWTAFRKRLQQEHIPTSFQDIIYTVKGFLLPVTTALLSNNDIPENWIPPGPWT